MRVREELHVAVLVAPDQSAGDAALDESEARKVDADARPRLVGQQPADLLAAPGPRERGDEAACRLAAAGVRAPCGARAARRAP